MAKVQRLQITLAGVLCPVALICNSLILLQEDDSPHRRTLCTVLIMSRHSIILFYWVILLFSFHFRLFLVLYADRGLLKNGKPNLKLFCQLYWVVMVVLLIFCFAMFPGKNLLKGNFILQDSKCKIMSLRERARTFNWDTFKEKGHRLCLYRYCVHSFTAIQIPGQTLHLRALSKWEDVMSR